jgi:hypothetical protein
MYSWKERPKVEVGLASAGIPFDAPVFSTLPPGPAGWIEADEKGIMVLGEDDVRASIWS